MYDSYMENKISLNKATFKEKLKKVGGVSVLADITGLSLHTIIRVSSGYIPSRPTRVLLSMALNCEESVIFKTEIDLAA